MSRVRAPSVTPLETVRFVGPFPAWDTKPVGQTRAKVSPGEARTAGGTDTLRATGLRAVTETPWITLVWNDPVNLMSYVAWVFRSYFGFPPEEADRRMLEVHNNGKAVVATGPREEMERHAEAMHDFGLWATIARAWDP